MPEYVFRKGFPVYDENGKLLYVQPVHAVKADDGNYYHGVKDPAGFVYNRVPSDMLPPPPTIRTILRAADGYRLLASTGDILILNQTDVPEYNSEFTSSEINVAIQKLLDYVR